MPSLRDDDSSARDSELPGPLLPSPGRDSSRLFQDIQEHVFADPRIHSNQSHFDPTKPPKISEPSHIHAWVMKTFDSLELRPWNTYLEDSYIVALCETCRTHMSLTGILMSEDTPKCGSSTATHKSHHFHLESWTNNTRSSSSSSSSANAKPEFGTFECCQCPFSLQIEFSLPIVHEYLLSSVKKRKTGNNSALSILTRSKDSKIPATIEAYSTLAKYVRDRLNGYDKDIAIQPDSAFSRKVGLEPDVIKFMESLGWIRQDPPPLLLAPHWDEGLERGRLRRKLLEAAELELAQLAIDSAKESDRSEIPGFEPEITRAENNIAKLMAVPWPPPVSDVRSEIYFRKSIGLDTRSNPSYACLGIVPTASESDIIKSYIRQITDDPANIVFYLECLQDIGYSTQSRMINQYVEKEVQKGIYTRFDLQKAYQVLEIDLPEDTDDDGIVAVYHSRCIDVPEREAEFQNALKMIQRFRKSDAIGQNITQYSDMKQEIQVEMSPAQAYKQLRIDDVDTSDDLVIASFISYSADYPHERGLLTEALHTLGKARNSLAIRSFLSEQNESQVSLGPMNRPMTMDEAFIILGIEGRAQNDDEAIMVAYNELVQLQPDRRDEAKKAVQTIGDHRDSIPLKTFLIDMMSTPDKQQAGPGSADRPVGLENIAQTCYMNSLFQYYFSLKTLRDAILRYEEFEEGDLSEEELKKKQITKWELERSKRFIGQLRLLFQELVTSELAYIRPKEELIHLTLESVKQEVEDQVIKRRESLLTNASHSLLDSEIPALIDVEDNDPPVVPASSPTLLPANAEIAPFLQPSLQEDTSTLSTHQITPTPEDADYEFVDHESNDSGVVSIPPSDPISVGKENAAQVQEAEKPFTPDTVPLQDNSQQVNIMTTEVKDEDAEMPDLVDFFNPPATPPAVPPRPPQRRKSTWGVMKFGSQQDVTECITNCLSQFHAAFKPDGENSHGEQTDLFKRLFYIRVKQVFRDLQAGPNAKPVDEKEELYGSILPVYVVPQAKGTLYDAIDLSLGRENIEYRGVGECEKTTTVTQLPPVLQIQIVRAQYDRFMGAGYKENTHLELEPKIYMDRYMDSTDEELTKRQDDYWKWKAELERVQRSKANFLKKNDLKFDPLELISSTRGLLQKLSISGADEKVPPELLDGLVLYETQLRKQVDKCDKDADTLKSRLKQQFTDRRQHGYRLHSVFIHRGDVAHGHYWIYIYDFAGNRWFKYNDESVTEVDAKVVYANDSAEGAGPYFITYVKEDIASELVEALNRDLSGNLMSFD